MDSRVGVTSGAMSDVGYDSLRTRGRVRCASVAYRRGQQRRDPGLDAGAASRYDRGVLSCYAKVIPAC